MEFLICSNNLHKLTEIKRILLDLGVKAYSPKELGIELGEIDETGTTFAENAEIKALAGLEKANLASIADDSGLCVDALDGRPGVYTARYGGEGLTDEERYTKLLEEMADVADENRTARFVSAICVTFSNGDKIVAEGYCEGKIGTAPSGENGFGYDPVFYVGEKSFAELSDKEKDALSHRGKALEIMKQKLSEYLSK